MPSLSAPGRRLGRKLESLVPLAVGSAVLFAVLWAVGQLVMPLLPADLRAALDLIGSGDFEAARDELARLLDAAPFPAELAFVGLQVAQVVIAPIPGQFVGLVAGYLFGFWLGLALTMAGLALGSLLAIGLGRLLGEKVVRRFLPRKYVARFDALVGGGGLWNFFLIFLLPVFPDDAACFLAGLTRLPILGLVGVAVLGRLPGMAVLAFVGASAGEGSTAAYVVLGVALALSVVLWLFSDEVEAWLERKRGARDAA
ncbi:MAG TPA: VTT domain-containing protein [Rubricoccaceae bacterium]|nr:VTT domain-containing protein [Rubricoccaceae bacterium]